MYWVVLISPFFYQIIMLFGDSDFLGRLKIGDEALYISGMDAKISEYRSDGDFIFYDRKVC